MIIVYYAGNERCVGRTIKSLFDILFKNEKKSRIVIRKMKNLYKISYEKSHKNSKKNYFQKLIFYFIFFI